MTNPETAVTVIEQSAADAVVEWNLDDWPASEYNRLVPTVTLGLANEFIRPIVSAVKLDIETDTYESRDLKSGHRAPNAKGLSKLADAAGVSFVDEVRLDDMRDPDRAYVRVYAEMIDPTGMKRRAPGSRDYVLSSQTMTDAQRNRARGWVHEHAATRAQHRALRRLLSLAQSYPVAELQKPFAVVRLVPNMQHPEVREAFKAAMVGSIAALYGPEPAKQLAAGPAVDELDEVDDDEPRNVTPAPETPTVMPGEKLAAAAPQPLTAARGRKADADSAPAASAAPGASVAPQEPDWITGGAGAAADDGAPSLRDVVAERMTDEGQPTGPIEEEQGRRLGALFDDLGEDRTPLVRGGIRALFGIVAEDLTPAQARAIAMAHDELGHEAFLADWKELAS
jgi:hypothetical protein